MPLIHSQHNMYRIVGVRILVEMIKTVLDLLDRGAVLCSLLVFDGKWLRWQESLCADECWGGNVRGGPDH